MTAFTRTLRGVDSWESNHRGIAVGGPESIVVAWV